jgi:xanthine/CO dehydrogenase XdhC/CoxF family maturation factor
VKHWQETAAILDRTLRLGERGARAALATVVRISGSAYRRPGAKFLVEEGGATCGGVSGGCLEADVREIATAVMREQSPRLLHYDTGSDEETVWGLGLGCEGAVDIFIRPVGDAFDRSLGQRMRELLAGGAPFAISTMVKGPHAGRAVLWAQGRHEGGFGDGDLDRAAADEGARLLETGGSGLLEIGAHALFTEALTPPPHLVVFGAGDDARPLARLAADVGFQVTVVDHRPGYLTPERLPPPVRLVLRRSEEGLAGMELGRRHFAVVQTHSLAHDREWMRALISCPIAYLGLLGPRARKEELLRQLGTEASDRIFAPVGLDLGAEGPEQVAVAIVAEMLAVRAGRQPAHLRARQGSIHEG